MAILCKYTYDPLDRVSTVTPLAQAVANRFYNGGQLMTELQGGRQRTCIRAGAQWLAQQSREGDEVVTTMIASDLHNSVLHASKDGHQADIAYTPFGHHQAGQTIAELPGFNGEQPDPLTGHYLLGNGYRAYNPVLMRFNSPDSMSPFGKGGLNVYAYCLGDPVNRTDATGHESWDFYASLAMAVVGVALGTYAFPKVLSVKAFGVTALASFGASAAATASVLTDYYDVEGGSELGWVAVGLGAFSLASGAMSAKSAFARGRARGPKISFARTLPTQRPAQSSAGLQTTSFILPQANSSPLSVAPAQSSTIRRTGYPRYRDIKRPVPQDYFSGVHKMPTIAEEPSYSIRAGDELVY
ncbi:RHS repeat-associated core domain-containing protein [Pseudomonas syringae]|uniref:RHS repeat-associated core domain-containing protein n=1 Tax=Pseudomonas syringae TaxID=317 RepID=UPI001F2A2EA2|nr:RHS repeat-associated core domain-containing protein [Pseudomonas syringae]MCF8984381.1 RHS repeat-associated core domain-containing protein [Pseudomonas syringae]